MYGNSESKKFVKVSVPEADVRENTVTMVADNLKEQIKRRQH